MPASAERNITATRATSRQWRPNSQLGVSFLCFEVKFRLRVTFRQNATLDGLYQYSLYRSVAERRPCLVVVGISRKHLNQWVCIDDSLQCAYSVENVFPVRIIILI